MQNVESLPFSSFPHELGPEVGRGAQGTVYKVQAPDQQYYAVKVFRSGILKDSASMERIHRQLKFWKNIQSPCLSGPIQLVIDPNSDKVALVSRFVEGENLASFQSKLPFLLPELSAMLMLKILDCVEAAHSENVLHRDLKPENIIVHFSKQNSLAVTLIDFDLGRSGDSSSLTLTGQMLGSPSFMAPELARGAQSDKRADIFSAGAILYFLVTGTRPFEHQNPIQSLSLLLDGKLEAPEKRNPKIGPLLSQIICKAMAKQSDERFQSAAIMSQNLDTYLRDLKLLDTPEFQLETWLKSDRSHFVFQMMNFLHQSLVRFLDEATRIDDKIDSKKIAELWMVLAHLNILAPESEHLSRFTEKLSLLLSKRKKKKSLFYFENSAKIIPVAGVLVLLIGITLQYFKNQKLQESVSPVLEPQTIPVEINDVTTSAAPLMNTPVVASKKVLAKKLLPASKKGRVIFDVSKDIRVSVNGQKIADTSQTLTLPLGEHNIKLERPGSRPIQSKIKVEAQSPTIIRVHTR